MIFELAFYVLVVLVNNVQTSDWRFGWRNPQW